MAWLFRFARFIQNAGNLLPDINPNLGVALDVYVPVIPEDELTTRPWTAAAFTTVVHGKVMENS